MKTEAAIIGACALIQQQADAGQTIICSAGQEARASNYTRARASHHAIKFSINSK
jgi:hypothetical protein